MKIVLLIRKNGSVKFGRLNFVRNENGIVHLLLKVEFRFAQLYFVHAKHEFYSKKKLLRTFFKQTNFGERENEMFCLLKRLACKR